MNIQKMAGIRLICITALFCACAAALFSCRSATGSGAESTADTDTTSETAAQSVLDIRSDTDIPPYTTDSSGVFVIDAGELRDADDLQDIISQIVSEIGPIETLFTVKLTGFSVPVSFTAAVEEGTAFLSSLTAFDRTITVDEQIELHGNCKINLYEAGEAVVFERLFYDVGDTYVIWDGGTYEFHPGETESVSLYTDGGALKYRRSANKFNGSKDQVGVLNNAFGRGDFLYEYGGVELDGDNLILSDPEKSFNISDVYDLDAEFASVWSSVYATIDDLFAANIETAKQNGTYTGYSADDWLNLGFESDDWRREYINAFLNCDTRTLESMSGVSDGIFDGYKTLSLSDYAIQASEDKTGTKSVTLNVNILSSGLESLPAGEHSFLFYDYPSMYMLDEANDNGIDTVQSRQLAEFLNTTLSYEIKSADLYEYIVSRLNANGVTVTSLAQITDFASRYLGVDGYIPKNPCTTVSNDGTQVYITPAHGGSHLIFTCTAQTEVNGSQVITVQFYADLGKTVASHLINYTVRVEDGGFAIIGEEILAESAYEPAGYIT